MLFVELLIDMQAMPILQFACHLGIDIAFLVEEVGSFIQVDNDMKKVINAQVPFTNRRHHRDSKQLAQQPIVEGVSASLQFIIHIERNNHAHIHVDKLGGEVEVPFQIGCIDYIDDHIRGFVDNVSAHIDLFGRIGRE